MQMKLCNSYIRNLSFSVNISAGVGYADLANAKTKTGLLCVNLVHCNLCYFAFFKYIFNIVYAKSIRLR